MICRSQSQLINISEASSTQSWQQEEETSWNICWILVSQPDGENSFHSQMFENSDPDFNNIFLLIHLFSACLDSASSPLPQFVCLFVCQQNYTKTTQQIYAKLRRTGHRSEQSGLSFGADPDKETDPGFCL